MNTAVSRLRSYGTLFLPSPMSAVFCVFLAALPLAVWSFPDVRNYLRLPDSTAVIQTAAGSIDRLLSQLIGESKVQAIVVGGFWAIVGLLVYLLLRSVARFISELDDNIAVRGYVWPKDVDRRRPLKVSLQKALIRGIAGLILLLVLFGPILGLFNGPVLTALAGPDPIVRYIVWYLAGLLLWHDVVVLCRIVALKARLAG